MPRLGDPSSDEEHYTSGWSLLVLIPVWILQALISFVLAILPSFCIISVCPTDTPVAFTLGAFSFALIIGEACLSMHWILEERTAITPRILAFQTAKCIVLVGQSMVVCLREHPEDMDSLAGWIRMVSMSVLFMAISLPFSLHLLYTIIRYMRALPDARETGINESLLSNSQSRRLAYVAPQPPSPNSSL